MNDQECVEIVRLRGYEDQGEGRIESYWTDGVVSVVWNDEEELAEDGLPRAREHDYDEIVVVRTEPR